MVKPDDSFVCPVAFLEKYVHNISTAEEKIQAVADDLMKAGPSSIVLAIILLCVSLFILFLGKKMTKPTVFLTSALAAMVSSFILVDAIVGSVPNVSEQLACGIDMGVPILLGLLAGVISLCVFNLGIALLGAGAGAGVGYVAYLAFLNRIPSPYIGSFDVVFVSSLGVCALLGMLIMCKFKTTLMIVATAAVGAAGSTIGTSWLLAHKWAQFIALYAITDVKALSSPFVYSQALYCVLLFLLGLLVQCKLEKKAKKDKDEKRIKVEIAPMANRGGASNEPLVGI